MREIIVGGDSLHPHPAVFRQICAGSKVFDDTLNHLVFYVANIIACRVQIIQRNAYRIGGRIRVPVIGLDVVSKTAILILVTGQNRKEILTAPVFKEIFPLGKVKRSCATVNQLS